jgi:hypothetical protein
MLDDMAREKSPGWLLRASPPRRSVVPSDDNRCTVVLRYHFLSKLIRNVRPSGFADSLAKPPDAPVTC